MEEKEIERKAFQGFLRISQAYFFTHLMSFPLLLPCKGKTFV
jgi:hypothetical protein